ncbi:hypothetical protein [Actinoplanes sp. NPDC026623]|jgi:hypothetical protein
MTDAASHGRCATRDAQQPTTVTETDTNDSSATRNAAHPESAVTS